MSSKAAAMAKLARARRTGERQSENVKVEEESLYQEVTEEEYRSIVRKRQKEDIVDGDDDHGYADHGEDNFEDDYYEDEEEGGEGGEGVAVSSSAAGARGSSAAAAAAPRGHAGSLLKASSGRGGGLGSASIPVVPSTSLFEVVNEKAPVAGKGKGGSKGKANIDNLLEELDDDLSALPASRKGGANARLSALATSSSSGAVRGAARSSSSAAAVGMDEGEVGGLSVPSYDASATAAAAGGDDDAADGEAASSSSAAAAEELAKKNQAPRRSLLSDRAHKAAAAAAAAAARALGDAGSSPMSPSSGGGLGGASSSSPLGAAAALTVGGEGGDASSSAAGGAAVAGGTTRPMTFETLRGRNGEESDSCLFYWLDCYEDPRMHPGQLFVFGKVMVNEKAVMEALRANKHVDNLAQSRAEKKRRAADKAAKAAAAAASGAPAVAGKDDDDDDDEDEGLMADAPLPAKVPVPQAQFASCCMTLNGNQRCCFILMRDMSTTGEPVDIKGLYQELSDEVMPSVIPQGKFRIKKVQRNYAFELEGVPREKHDYIKLVYPAVFNNLPQDISGRTFVHIFGTQTTVMEHFLLKRKLKGPCWLRITGARNNPTPVSHCAFDIVVDNPKNIVVYGECRAKGWLPGQPLAGAFERTIVNEVALPVPIPSLTVLSISLKTVVGARGHQHEIVMASMVVHDTVSPDGGGNESLSGVRKITIVRPPDSNAPGGGGGLPLDFRTHIGAQRPDIKYASDERTLLNMLLLFLVRVDPDVLVGHNIVGFDLDVILHRIAANSMGPSKVADWSRIGRFKRKGLPRVGRGVGGRDQFTGILAAGRLVCDTYRAAQEHVRQNTYSLSALSRSLLHEERAEIEASDVPRLMLDGKDAVQRITGLCDHTARDAALALQLMFNLQIIPLTKQLTNLAGNLWSRSLLGSRAERIEYLLLHEFHRVKFVLPDKAKFGEKDKPAAADLDEELQGDDDDDDEVGAKAGKGKGRVLASGNAARFAKGRNKPAYAGGLVLEPKKGLYDKFVLLLDFQSLYPSIIQEFNICFTTVDRKLKPMPRAITAGGGEEKGKGKGKGAGKGKGGSKGKGGKSNAAADGDGDADLGGSAAAGGGGGGDEEEGGAAAAEEEEEEDADTGPEVPRVPDKAKYTEDGILPRVIASLVQARRRVKNEAARESDPGRRSQLDIRQKALKILANSMYGCLGFSHSRFFAKPIAALVTSQGREILQQTVDLATNKLGLEVIYGDTDSVMIHTASTDIEAVKKMGQAMKAEVNSLHKKLEIEIDGIFSMMLLLKKKKYAALKVSEMPGGGLKVVQEVKGLDMVRRDWCNLSRELGRSVLDLILSGREREDVVEAIHKLLGDTATAIRAGQVPMSKFIITKGLNKAPEDYADIKSQPHLQVALAMKRANRTVNVGDTIEFVICAEMVGTVDLSVGSSPSTGAMAMAVEAAAAAAAADAASASPSHPPSSPAAASASASPGGAAGMPATPSSPASPDASNVSPSSAGGAFSTSPNTSPVAAGSSGSRAGSSVGVAMRAYSPWDVERSGGRLHIDVEWYLSQQVLPPIARLCETIEGTSQARIADVLGLDTSRFARSLRSGENRDDDVGFVPRHTLPDEERFRGTETFVVTCVKCGHTAPFPGVYAPIPGAAPQQQAPGKDGVGAASVLPVRSGLFCTKNGCSGMWGCKDGPPVPAGAPLIEVSRSRLSNFLIQSMRRTLFSLQQGWLVCEDGMCATRTRSMTTRKAGYACVRPGCNSLLKAERDAASIHLQLEYYSSLFNMERSQKRREKAGLDAPQPTKTGEKGAFPLEHGKVYEWLAKDVSRLLEECAYHYVQPTLFSYVNKINAMQGVHVKPIPGLTSRLGGGMGGGMGSGMGMGGGGGPGSALSTPGAKGRRGSSLAAAYSPVFALTMPSTGTSSRGRMTASGGGDASSSSSSSSSGKAGGGGGGRGATVGFLNLVDDV